MLNPKTVATGAAARTERAETAEEKVLVIAVVSKKNQKGGVKKI
jgi:hypothetical protein